MDTRLKRFLSLALTLVMVISMMPTTAFATETECAHEFGEAVAVVAEATCNTAGSGTLTCGLCGATTTVEIEATGVHTYVDGVCACGANEVPTEEPVVLLAEDTTPVGAAKIGDNYFATLGEALAVLKSGETLEILQSFAAGANEFIELNGKTNVTVKAAEGVEITGDISFGYHASHTDSDVDRSESTLTIEGLTVKGTLTVYSNDANLIVKNNKAAQITVKTYREAMNVSFTGNKLDGNIGTAANSYGVFMVPNATGYSLVVNGNTFDNVDSHAFVVQGCGDGAAVTAAESISLSDNTFNSWGLGGKSNRAAFKIWADTKYAPASSNLVGTTEAMRVLVQEIAAANTFNSTAANTVQFDAYDAAGNVEDFPKPRVDVATINGVGYETLQAAIDAAGEGDTVVMLSDVSYELDVSTFTAKHGDDDAAIFVAADDKLTLDLNGKTISVVATLPDGGATKHSGALINHGDLTIDDSSVNKNGKLVFKYVGVYDGGNKRHGAVMNLGKLTINNGTVENITALENQPAIDNTNYNGTDVYVDVNGGTVKSAGYYAIDMIGYYDFAPARINQLTVDGGTIDGGIYARIQSNTDFSVIVNDGEIKSDFAEAIRYRVYYAGNTHAISVTGGEFSTTAENASTIRCQLPDGETLAGFISGGTFDADISKFVADGYQLNQNTDGTFGVAEKEYPAKIGSQGFATLKDALLEAAKTDELTVITLAAGEHTFGSVKFPANLKNVTIKGSEGTVLKNTTLMSSDGSSVKYEGITIDGIEFNGSNIVFTGARNGEVIYKDITITNCEFYNVVTNNAFSAVHFNLASDEKIENLTFTNNTINGVADDNGDQYPGGLRANYVTGNIIITGNNISNVPNNAIQVINVNASKIVIENNVLAADLGAIANLYNATATEVSIKNNQFLVKEDQTAISYITNIDVSGNYWGGNAPAKLPAGVTCKNYYTGLNADGTIDTATLVTMPVVQIGENKYQTLEAAAAAAKAGDTITLLNDVIISEKLTLPAGITLNGNGKSITGAEVWADGDLTFVGHTKVTMFNAGYNKPVITIGEGACLELIGTGRMVIGHGATFNITGTITDAKTADVANVTPSLIAAGASFTGAGVNFNVTNAYVKFTAYCSSKNNSASGTHNFNITNSIWDQTGSFVFTEPTSGKDPTFNLTLKDSVLNSTSHLVFAVTKGEIVFDNSNVNVGVYRQLENRATLTIKNGSVVYASVQVSSNAKNPGTTIVENATYVTTGEFSGADVGTGTLIIKKGANITVGKITKANIVIDATGMTAGEVAFTGDLSKFAGTLSVINNDTMEAKIVDGKIVLVANVAKIGDTSYTTLKDAIEAVADGGTITMIADHVITEGTRTHNSGSWYDGIYYIGDKSFTIDLGGFTISHDGSVNDYLLNFKNEGTKANTITLKNGTVDAGNNAFCALCTSSAQANQLTINLEDINLINNISNGSTAKIRGGVILNVKDGTTITGKNSYLGIECVASTVNIYDGAEIYMNGSSSYNGCLVGACNGGTVNVYGGYGKGVKGGFIAMTSGGTINVSGGEWIANTDGSVGNNSNLYVLTAQSNKYESGFVGPAIINVTGGTFRGGMDAWVLNNIADEKAELNISGGNFNADPTKYLKADYVATATDGVFVVAKAPVSVSNNVVIKDAAGNAVSGNVVTEITNAVQKNEALIDYTPSNVPKGATLSIVLKGAEISSTNETAVTTKLVFDVEPQDASGKEVEPTAAITFRLPVPAGVSATYANVYHDGTPMGLYQIQSENGAKFVEISSADFSEFAVEFTEKTPVAMIGETNFATLQDAVNAVQNGQTITLLTDITENVTLTEKVGLYYTIDGDGNDLNGTITISALSDTNDNRRITIKNIDFVTDVKCDFISSVKDNHYPRITVEGCSFTGTGADKADTVAIRLKSSHSVVITDCIGTGLHSFLQNTAGWNLTIELVTITDSKGGLSLGTVQGVTVKDCDIDVAGYGIRMDAQYNNNAVIDSNTVAAYIPVVVRKAEVDSKITFQGTNTMNATNTDGMWCVVGKTEYESGVALPTDAIGKVVVALNDAGLTYAGVSGNYAVASVNDVEYATLADAVAAADGKTVTVLRDVTVNEMIVLRGDKDVTIEGAGKTITFNNTKYGFGVVESTLTLGAGLNIVAKGDTCPLYVQNGTAVTAANIMTTEENGYSPVMINGGYSANVTINGGKITSGNSAVSAIYWPGEGTLTVNDGTIEGATGIYFKSGNLVITGGEIIGNGAKQDYGYVASGNAPTGDALVIENVAVNDYEAIGTVSITGGTFTSVNASAVGSYAATSENSEVKPVTGFISGGTYSDPSAELYLAEGCALNVQNGKYVAIPAPAKVIASVEGEDYTSLQAAINAAAASGEPVYLLDDVTLNESLNVPEGKAFVLNLKNHKINTAWADEAAEKHIYAIYNYGSMTVTGGGEINSRGIYNYGKLVLGNATLNAIDHNGGYAVWNQSGSEFILNGGTIAATNENGDAPTNGYDATTLRVEAGATATIKSGKINNISNYTFAIDNAGTVTVEGGEISSVHTTLGNYGSMTINGGSFTCNGLEGISAHALWAAGGTTTINGGTFDGKDNNNGFNVCVEEGVVVNITGGTFLQVHSGSLYGKGTIAVSGGTFFDKISADRCVENFEPEKNADGTYSVVKVTYVATVNGIKYKTLKEAIGAVQEDETVVLLCDLNEAVSITSGKFTLDLNGKKITAANIDTISVTNNAEVTIKNGTLESAGNNCGGVYAKNSTVVLDGCTLVGTNATLSCGVYASDGSTVTITDCTLTANHYGVIMMSANVTVNGDTTITAPTSVSANGSDAHDKANLTINDGIFNGAIYWPANGKLTINDGVFTAETAVYVKSGSLEINGGTFTGNGEKKDYAYKDSGFNATGEAIVIENVAVSEYDAVASVSINGGTFTSVNANAIGSYVATDKNPDAEAVTGFISGGDFSAAPEAELIATGYEVKANDDGTYGVVVDPAYGKLAMIGDTYYATVADALAAAKTAGMTDVTITLIGETTKASAMALEDSFNLYYQREFDSVTFKQADASQVYYIDGIYTGSRTNGGSFIFDGVNIVVTGQYIFEGNVKLTNNSIVKSVAEANCFMYYSETTVEPGSKLFGVIDDYRGGDVIVDGGRTDGAFNTEPDMQNSITIINWSGDSLTIKNGAYVKVNAANEVGRLTVNAGASLNITDSKLDAVQYIAINGTVNTDIDSLITTQKITGAGKIVVDAAGITGDVQVIKADMSGFTGTIEVTGAAYEITSEGLVITNPVATVNGVGYKTLQAALNAAQENDTIILVADIEEGEIYLPNEISGLTITAEAGVVVKNTVITTPDLTTGSTIDYNGLTITGVAFDNSRIYIKGWASSASNQSVSVQNLAITDCTFKNLVTDGSGSPVVNLNMATSELVKNFTFTGNTIENVSGGENAGVYALVQGEVNISGNTIKNIGGTPINVQFANANVVVTNNILENWGTCGKGRAIRGIVFDDSNATLTIAENVMIHENAPEQFVKITGENNADPAAVTSINKNYWSGKSPADAGIIDIKGEYADNYYASYDVESGLYDLTEITYAAMIGDTKYTTITAAINAANNGDIVKVMAGEFAEAINWANAENKSITLQGAAARGEGETILTGGMSLGVDNSKCNPTTITVEGFTFKTKGILVASQKNVVIENNKFEDITDYAASSDNASQNAISVIGKNINATIRGNEIENVESCGIHLRDVASATVSGNTVTNVKNTSIMVNTAANDLSNAVVIEDNVLTTWSTGGEGRAIRVSGAYTTTITENIMSSAVANEEYVKVSGMSADKLIVNANYWNGENPAESYWDGSNKDKTKLFGAEGLTIDVVADLESYYADAAKTNLVPIEVAADPVAMIGNNAYATVMDAVAAANAGDTIVMIADATESFVLLQNGVTLNLNGHTLTCDNFVTLYGTQVMNTKIYGILKVSQTGISLQATNTQIPVWNGVDGYYLVDIGYGTKLIKNDDGSIKYSFMARPRNGENGTYTTNTNVIALLQNGVADNQIDITVHLNWEDEAGTMYQRFVYNENQISTVYTTNSTAQYSGWMFNITVTNYENYDNVTLQAVVESDMKMQDAAALKNIPADASN